MEELIWFLIFLGGSVFGFFIRLLKNYLTDYVKEKGKNLATKEDIQEITEKVEGVKSYFTDRTEKLRADLNADIQRQLSLFGKRNEALTQLFEDAFTVLTHLRTGFHFSYEDIDGLDEHIRQGQERIVRAITSGNRLMLYVQEESILTPARNVLKALDFLHGAWFELTLNFRNAFSIEVEEYERNGRVTSTLSIQAAAEMRKGIDDTVNTLEDILKEYAKALYAHFHPADDSKALTATTDAQTHQNLDARQR